MNFDSYESLENWMLSRKRSADLKNIHSYLIECVEREARSLVEHAVSTGRAQRRSKGLLKECTKDAQEHYCEEINEAFASNEPLHHWTMMSYRRKPHAWAVAKGILEFIERKNATNTED